jgi:hypothetical protein
MADFYIRFIKKDNQTQIEYLWDRGKNSPLPAPTIAAEERDRRIITILRKYLDMEFASGQINVFERRDFEALGELLFDLIFQDNRLFIEFNDWHNTALDDDEKAEGYNIFLEFEQINEFDDLAILPWEYIFFSKQKKKGIKLTEPFLAASPSKKINFYRKFPLLVHNTFDKESFEITTPLRILLIISNPAYDAPVTTKNEVVNYFKKLNDQIPHVEIRYLYQPDYKNFRNELDYGQSQKSEKYILDGLVRHDDNFSPDILHFVGHSSVEGNRGMLFFAKEDINQAGPPDKTFKTEKKSDEWFSTQIKDSRIEPKLVFLQICNGARIIDYYESKGTAICLLDSKIPFVIAMQNPVQENHAQEFTENFYDEFIKGKDIGACVTKGRYELGTQREFKEKAFGSPVLLTYVNYPLKLKISLGEEKPAVKLEKVIKICNTPGCPYFNIEETGEDTHCKRGHLLVGKSSQTRQPADASHLSRSEAVPPMRQAGKQQQVTAGNRTQQSSVRNNTQNDSLRNTPPASGINALND